MNPFTSALARWVETLANESAHLDPLTKKRLMALSGHSITVELEPSGESTTLQFDGDSIRLKRVEEVFETEQIVIPFERQVVRNETIPEGQTRLVQAGVNGLQEVTYRRILEDGIETSKTAVKTVVLNDALPEIVMVGAQSSFAPLQIPAGFARHHIGPWGIAHL